MTDTTVATGLSVAPATPTIGATVTGIDLAKPQSHETLKELYLAVCEFGVLFFPEQFSLTPETQRSLGQSFGGSLHVHPSVPGISRDYPEILAIAESQPLPWHSDATFEAAPPMGSILRAIKLPAVGGGYSLGKHVCRI